MPKAFVAQNRTAKPKSGLRQALSIAKALAEFRETCRNRMRSKNRQGSVMLKIAVFTRNSPNPAGIPVASILSDSGHKTINAKNGRIPDRHTDQGAAPVSTNLLSDKEKFGF